MEAVQKSIRRVVSDSRRPTAGWSTSVATAKRTVVAILVLSAGVLAGRATETVSMVILERIDQMDQLATAMKAISTRINSNGDLAEVKKQASGIREIAESLPALFPEGSGEGRTDAKPEIWSNRQGFEARARQLVLQAKKLELAAAGNDSGGFLNQFHVVEQVCSDCHELFRAKKTTLTP